MGTSGVFLTFVSWGKAVVWGLRTAVVAVIGVRAENPCKHNVSKNLSRRLYITNVKFINFIIFKYYKPTLIHVREFFARSARALSWWKFLLGNSPFCLFKQHWFEYDLVGKLVITNQLSPVNCEKIKSWLKVGLQYWLL